MRRDVVDELCHGRLMTAVGDVLPGFEPTDSAPLYTQLKGAISAAISSGQWGPGHRLPSEATLCDHFGISRTTVRQALNELELKGALRREQGRGTFVAETAPGTGFLQSAGGFFEEAAAGGHEVTSKVLKRTVERLPDEGAYALGLEPGAFGITLERLRSVDGEAVMYVRTHLLLEFADGVLGADLGDTSLYRTLRERHGVCVHGGHRSIEAVLAEEPIAGLLEVDPGFPLLAVHAVSSDQDGRPFECYRAWHRSDRSRLEVRVAPEDHR